MRGEDEKIISKRALLLGGTAAAAVALPSLARGATNVGPLMPKNNLADVDDANASLNSILPSQTGNAGKALTTDGTNVAFDGIDLDGGVTGILQFENGGRSQIGHPLRGDRRELCRAPGEHIWSGPIVYDPIRFRWWHFFSSTWHHGPSYGAGLQVHWSEDGFQHDDNPQDIISEVGWEYQAAFGSATVYPSGRVGIVLFARSVSTSKMLHAYTDNGSTWVIVNFTPSIALVPVGVMQDIATGVKAAYGYGSPRGKEEPIWLTIMNEGSSSSDFASGTCYALAPSVDIAEPTVFKIGTNQYGMLGRNDASDSTTAFNAMGSISTDGKNFSAPVDSGVRLGFNPVTGIVDDTGVLWGYSVFRGAFQDPGDPGYAGITPDSGSPIPAGDSFGVVKTPAATFFANSGVFPVGDRVWVAVDQMPARNTGSIYYCRDTQGNYWATAGAQEILLIDADPAAEMMAILFSPTKPIIPRMVAYAPCENELDNSYFRQRLALAGTLANTGGAIGGVQATDRWFWDGHTVSTAAITFPDIGDDIRRLVPGRPNTGLGIASAGGQFCNLNQTRLGKGEIQRFSDRIGWFQLFVQGAIPFGLSFQALYNFGSGGSTSVALNTSLGHAPVVDGLYHIRRKILFPSTEGVSWGTDPYVTFRLIDTGVTNNTWACTLIAAKLGLSPDYDPIIRPIEADEDLVLDKYLEYQQFTAGQFLGTAWAPGAAVATIPLQWEKKVAIPAPFIRAPAVGDFVVNGTNSDNATTIIDNARDRGTLRMNITALSSGAPYPCSAAASSPPLLVIPTGI